ncbi:MAG: cobalamin biosynthesis protein [Lachnospiraceae bacterium]|nr:cobalamin biosynthesis protein [Lachnospiraceae bacterium]
MTIRVLTFSDKGESVAEKLCKKLMAFTDIDFMRCGETISLSRWTKEWFFKADALVFIGACGIAVRAVAPFVESKVSDPAVVVVDELGHFAIPILSGHLGGANELASQIAEVLGAQAVITTATDINKVFAIDDWARRNDCVILDAGKIKDVAVRLLDGGTVTIKSNFPIAGREPVGVSLTSEDSADVHISTRREGIFGGRAARQVSAGPFDAKDRKKDPMIIVPHIAVLGIGCRKGTKGAAVEKCFEHVLNELGIFEEAFYRVCSIDLKKDEPAIREFCEVHSLPFYPYSSDELKKVPGEFSSSGFVEEITGVDNVCERSAALGAGDGRIVLKKVVWDGVTMAVAFRQISLVW